MEASEAQEKDLQWKIFYGILAGMALGIGLNFLYGKEVEEGFLGLLQIFFSYGGEIFVRLLRMLIVPMVAASIFTAVVNLGKLSDLGRVGAKTLIYYFTTTGLAVLTGLILVNITHPGLGLDPETLAQFDADLKVPEKVTAQGVGERSAFLIIADTLVGMIPKNPAAALAEGDMLQIIFFSIFFAIMTTTLGKDADTLVQSVHIIDRIAMRSIGVIMKIAPYCIFFLVAHIFMDLGWSALKLLAKYGMTVVLGLIIHACVILPLLVLIVGRYSPLKLLRIMSPALLTAWSTASSAATLPLTMRCIDKGAKVDSKIGDFVLPLGATVNMDGTALYESVAVIFIAELLGFELTMGMQAVIFLTATLAAVGAAAIPGAGLVTMGIVLTAVGLPLDGIGLILAIDRLLDQFRTTVNVWGDSTAAIVVGRLENAIPDDS